MRFLRSYRWRRRIIITAVILGIGGPGIWLAVASSHGAPSSAPSNVEVAAPKYTYHPPKQVAFTHDKKVAVHRVLKKFILSAVARRHVADSWDLVGPGLRQNLTKREWATGAIPVTTYPVRNKDVGVWDRVEYSYKDAVGLETLLWPKLGSGERPLSADVDVVRNRHGQWRVNYFMPTKYHGEPALTKAQQKAQKRELKRQAAKRERKRTRRVAAPPVQQAPHLRGAWWTIPLILLGAAIFIPISVGVFFWVRNRRAAAAWERSR